MNPVQHVIRKPFQIHTANVTTIEVVAGVTSLQRFQNTRQLIKKRIATSLSSLFIQIGDDIRDLLAGAAVHRHLFHARLAWLTSSRNCSNDRPAEVSNCISASRRKTSSYSASASSSMRGRSARDASRSDANDALAGSGRTKAACRICSAFSVPVIEPAYLTFTLVQSS